MEDAHDEARDTQHASYEGLAETDRGQAETPVICMGFAPDYPDKIHAIMLYRTSRDNLSRQHRNSVASCNQ